MKPTPKAIIAAVERRTEEWQAIAAKREADHAAIAKDHPHAEINIDKKRKAAP